MAWQLIYTSAEHGLAAGRSGFCIVAQHAEIRERLVAELERLSVFDRPPTGQPLPVVRAHRILTIGSDYYHILSCIQDAGPDYSGRTNHIAHHLICEDNELAVAASPALVLRGFPWRKRWDEPARYFDDSERENLACFRDPNATGSAWKKLTGNPAHARLLIEPVARAGCYVAYRPGDDDSLLFLFDESLGRLAGRTGAVGFWQVSFTTLLQATDNPSEFTWRGCWAGGTTHHEAATASALIFDLTRTDRLPSPPPLEMPKIATDRATVVQQTVKARIQRDDTAQRKSTWKKVGGSYEGLSEGERQQRLSAQIPPEVLAKQNRRTMIKLFVWCALLAGVASLFLWPVPRRWIGWAKRWVQEDITRISRDSQERDGTRQPSNKPPTSTAHAVQEAATTANTAIQSTPGGEPALTNTENELLLNVLGHFPKAPTYFLVRPLRGQGVDVSQIITGKLPDQCYATFVQSHFTNFPSIEGTESLTVVKGEDSVTHIRKDTEEVFTIVNGKLTIPTSVTSGAPPTTITIDGDTYENVRWDKVSPTAVTIYHRTGVATIPLEKLPPELEKRFDYRPAVGNIPYDDAALWFGQNQVILLDQSATGAPFPAWHLGTKWLEITADNQKVTVKTNLVGQLQKAFPVAQVRLASDNLNPLPVVLVIDLQEKQQAVQKRIHDLSVQIEEYTKRDSDDRFGRLTSVLTGKLGNGPYLLERAEIKLDDKERQDLGKFIPTAKEPKDLWNQYIEYLRRILEKVSSGIPQQDKLDLVESAQPNDLLEFTHKLDTNLNRSFNDRLNRFRNAWANTFNQDSLNQVEDALRPASDIQQHVKTAEQNRDSEQLALKLLPKNVTALKPLRLEIYAGENWRKLIIFEDKP